jgi:hypothetical protein
MANFQGFNSNNTLIAPNQLSTRSVAAINGGGQITGNPPAFTLADLSQPGPPPQTIDQTGPTSQVLRYPADLPPYYFFLKIYKYSRASWLSVGTENPVAWIALPLPSSMIDARQVNFDIQPLGAMSAALLDASLKAMNANLAGAAGSLVKGAVGTGAQALAETAQATQLLNVAGAAINEFRSVMLQGPDYNRRTFSWRFSPETAAESETLRQIIQLLNNCISPSLSSWTGSAFWLWPYIFTPSFNFESLTSQNGLGNVLGDQTFYCRKSAITNMSTNYAPSASPAFYAGTHAPAMIELSLEFLELELWTSGTYKLGGPYGADPSAPVPTVTEKISNAAQTYTPTGLPGSGNPTVIAPGTPTNIPGNPAGD